MYNKVILAGNLTRDIELRYTQGGSAIGKTGIAINRKFKSQTGEQKEEVLFIDLTFFGRTAEIANQYLRKGSKVLVDGRLTLEQWTTQDGSKRSKHSIIVENLQMLGSSNEITEQKQNEHEQKPDAYTEGGVPVHYEDNEEKHSNIPEIYISEDEVPF